MEQRPLGRTGLSVSAIGFGAASFWGHPAFPEAEAIRLVHRALDLGVTLFDTGPAYSRGQAEGRLGRALRGRDASGLVVATKVGTRFESGRVRRDMSLPAIEASLERSRRRLGVETLPLVHLHGPSVAELTPDFLGGLGGFRARGLYRHLGVNSFDPSVIDAALSLPEIDTVVVDLNVLRPERLPLVARAARAGKGVLAGMPLAMGHTAPKRPRDLRPSSLWYALRALKNHRSDMALGRRFRFLHQQPEISGAQALLAWVLATPGVSAAIAGTTRFSHLQENLAAAGLELPEALAGRIQATQSLD